MPESRRRKKSKPAPIDRPGPSAADQSNPTWFVPTFVTLLVVGLAWVVVTYILDARYPIPGIGSWNLVIGFGLILSGFVMTMRWR